jgi:hypothetical protein
MPPQTGLPTHRREAQTGAIGELPALFSAFAFAFGTMAIAKAGTRGSGQVGGLLSAMLSSVLALICWGASGWGLISPGHLFPTVLAWFAVSGVLRHGVGAIGQVSQFLALTYTGVSQLALIKLRRDLRSGVSRCNGVPDRAHAHQDRAGCNKSCRPP